MSLTADEIIAKLMEAKEHCVDGRVVPVCIGTKGFSEDPYFPCNIIDIKYGKNDIYIYLSYE